MDTGIAQIQSSWTKHCWNNQWWLWDWYWQKPPQKPPRLPLSDLHELTQICLTRSWWSPYGIDDLVGGFNLPTPLKNGMMKFPIIYGTSFKIPWFLSAPTSYRILFYIWNPCQLDLPWLTKCSKPNQLSYLHTLDWANPTKLCPAEITEIWDSNYEVSPDPGPISRSFNSPLPSSKLT